MDNSHTTRTAQRKKTKMPNTMTNKTGFEVKTCSRCYGSGKFSWNPRDGSVCFGCGGSGQVFTKRGAAAMAFYRESVTVPASEIQVGDLIAETGMTLGGGMYSRKARVLELIAEHENGYSVVNGEKVPNVYIGYRTEAKGEKMTSSVFKNTPVRKYFPKDENDQKIAEALAYQETLTQAGTPRKR